MHKLTLFLALLLLLPTALRANQIDQASELELYVTAQDGSELVVSHYPAQGDVLVLWIGSSYNPSHKVFKTAHRFAQNNMEVWMVDFAEIFFQTKTSNFMRNLDAQYVADIIKSAHEKTGKQIVLITRAYGAIPTMRGATLWQQQNPKQNYLKGAILFSPDFISSIPDLGLDPDYLPITGQTTLPIFIFQGGRRGTAWQFPRLLKVLNQSNQNVYYKYLPGVAGVFFVNDNEKASLDTLEQLPNFLPGVIKLLSSSTAQPATYNYVQNKSTQHKALLNFHLKPYKGKVTPTPFTLLDSNDKSISMTDFKGQVTVVNFWATWCSPCVEEIPSLNRLRTKMQGRKFELISINYAESKQMIKNFFKQVNVEFPVLLDHDGKVSAQWNVIAFPSTFVIGPDGKIKYGINSAIRWDADEVVKLLSDMQN